MRNGEPGFLSAKPCYSHLGGTLGTRLFQRLIALDWFEPDENGKFYRITPAGQKELERLGVDICEK